MRGQNINLLEFAPVFLNLSLHKCQHCKRCMQDPRKWALQPFQQNAPKVSDYISKPGQAVATTAEQGGDSHLTTICLTDRQLLRKKLTVHAV